MTIEELKETLVKLEGKDYYSPSIELFSDGSGLIRSIKFHKSNIISVFNNLDELKLWIKKEIEG
jgi:hypothetical protein